MDYQVFFAWQSDTDPKLNHYLIRDAAKTALKQLGNDPRIAESLRLEKDTQGNAGMPAITETIFAKIRESDVIIADVTLVGTTDDARRKRMPNPNVLLELGYAAHCMGWERVICVMNTAYGPVEDQIFDLKDRRRPFVYDAPLGAQPNECAASLSEKFKEALIVMATVEHSAIDTAIRRLDLDASHIVQAFGANESFSDPNAGAYVVGCSLDTPSFKSGLRTLLDLGLVWTDFNPGQDLYAYHWTYRGKLIAQQLGFRPMAK